MAKRHRRRAMAMLGALLLVGSLAACGKKSEGKECDTCDSDSDCRDEMKCRLFCCYNIGGSRLPQNRCAKPTTQTCPA